MQPFINIHGGATGLSPGGKGARLTSTHIRLALRLKMSGAILLLSPYVFMAWTDTNFPFIEVKVKVKIK